MVPNSLNKYTVHQSVHYQISNCLCAYLKFLHFSHHKNFRLHSISKQLKVSNNFYTVLLFIFFTVWDMHIYITLIKVYTFRHLVFSRAGDFSIYQFIFTASFTVWYSFGFLCRTRFVQWHWNKTRQYMYRHQCIKF